MTLPPGLRQNPSLATWIGFEEPGRVRISTGKVEIGQGVLTALAGIAAAELDVAPGRIDIHEARTDRGPNEGVTAGSFSISLSGPALAAACAEARARLLACAGERLECDAAEFTVDDGALIRGGRATGLDYWTLAQEVDLAQAAAGAPSRLAQGRAPPADVPRLDLPRKLRGAAFIHDLAPPGVRHARVLRRPSPDARLLALDADVVVRRTAPDVEVVRIEDFVAVVAPDEHRAEQALSAATAAARWSEGGRWSEADGEARTLLALPSSPREVVRGEGAAGGSVTATYARPYIAHASIAPSCGLAEMKSGRLSVWTHSQNIHGLRWALARALGLDLEQIVVAHAQGAGCYGRNPADDAAFDAALIACARPGAPVRVQWTRAQELASGRFGPAAVVRLQADLEAHGRPRTIRSEIWSGVHGNRPGMGGEVHLLGYDAAFPTLRNRAPPEDVPDAAGGGATRNAGVPYAIAGQTIVHHLVADTPLPTASLRGLGAQVNVFAIESFIDELAQRAAADPVAWRLAMLEDPRARAVCQRAAAMAGWSDRPAGGEGRGWGFAYSRYKEKAAYVAVVAEVEISVSVRVRRLWSAVDAGLVVSRDGVLNQLEGGAVQAVSWALKEQVRVGPSGVLAASWEDYPILRFSELPELAIDLLPSDAPEPLGVGEAMVGPVTAALGNAVAHALGVRVRDLPFTRERIEEALRDD